MPEIVDNVEYLAKTIGPRPAGTEEEQQAALYITEQLQKDAGLPATIEDFGGVFDSELTGIICGAVALVAAVIGLAVPVLGIPSILLALIAAGLYGVESFGTPVLARFLGRGVSQNVVAKYDPGVSAQSQKRRRKVILVANYDSGKVRQELRSPIVNFLQYIHWASLGGMVLLLISLIFRNIFLLNSTGFAHGLFTVLAVLGAILSLIPLALGVLHKTAPYNEGANCNASGVAVMLEVARRIGNGRVSEAELAQREAVIHGEEAALQSDLVPVGTEIVYESQKLQAPEPAPMTDAARLASAKAAIAALTGKPVAGAAAVSDISANLVNVKEQPVPVPTDEEAHEWREQTREALSGEDFASEDADAQQIDPVDTGDAPVQAADAVVDAEVAGEQAAEAAASEVEPEMLTGMAAGTVASVASAASGSVPSWFKRAQANAKKHDEEATGGEKAEEPQIRRSRFAVAEEARLAAEEAAQAAAAAAKASAVSFPWQQEQAAAEQAAQLEVPVEGSAFGVEEAAAPAEEAAQAAPEAVAEAAPAAEAAEAEVAPVAAETAAAPEAVETPEATEAAESAPAAESATIAAAEEPLDGATIAFTPVAFDLSEIKEATAVKLPEPDLSGFGFDDEKPAAESSNAEAPAAADAEAADEEPVVKRSRYAEVFEATDAITAAAEAAAEPEVNIDLAPKDAKAQVLDALSTGVLPFADATPVQEAIANDAITEASTELYGVDLTAGLDAIAKPLTDQGEIQETQRTDTHKQRAPLAEASVAGQAAAAKTLLSSLPSISMSMPVVTVDSTETPAATQAPSHPDLRATLPSLSGLIGKPIQVNDTATESSVVNTAGSFVAASATGTFAPIGDELLQDVAPEDVYVDDADDSAYDDTYTETGAFAGPGYVEMPKSRIRRWFDKFGRKDKGDEQSTTDWLEVDDDFDARSVGAARGSWESFRNEEEPAAEATQAIPAMQAAPAPVAEPAPAETVDETVKLEPVSYQDTAEPAYDDFAEAPVDNDGFDVFQQDAFGQPFDDFYDDADDYYAGEDGYVGGDVSQDEYNDFLNGGADEAPKKKHFWQGGAFNGRLQEEFDSDSEGLAQESAEAAKGEGQVDEELQQIYQFRNPDVNTEVWFVGLGSELSGHAGIRAFLSEHADELRGAIVVDLTAMGAGELSLIEHEGAFKTTTVSSRMKRYLNKVAKTTGIVADKADLTWEDSAASVSMKQGVQGMHLVGMDGAMPAGYGQADDVSESVDEATMLANADFIMELIKNI